MRASVQADLETLKRVWDDVTSRTTQPSGRMEVLQLAKFLDTMFAQMETEPPDDNQCAARFAPACACSVTPAHRRPLSELQYTEKCYLKEFQVWDLGFAELVRQVYVHCVERGQLLEKMRERYVSFYETRQRLFQHMLHQVQAQVAHHEDALQARAAMPRRARLTRAAAQRGRVRRRDRRTHRAP
jgi:hypothetical protein